MTFLSVGLVLLSSGMHAGWNLIVRAQREKDAFLRMSIVIVLAGILPSIAAELFGAPVISVTWGYILLAGVSMAVYYLGLTLGYAGGDFTVVYPLARALPVLLVAVADIVRGRAPSPFGWAGLVLVSVGCMLTPLDSLRELRLAQYWNRTTAWALVAAAGGVGYSIADSVAAAALAPGPSPVARYLVYETLLSIVVFWPLMKALNLPTGLNGGWVAWKWPTVAACFMFVGYSLILWAFQVNAHASYVVAMRQFSIVVGVVVAAVLFREPAPGLRIVAALVITLGIALIVVAR